MESKIIDYLKFEYQPEAILLGGSRMKGIETEKSDWDLFLVGAKKENGGFVEFEGQRLDVTCKAWPEEGKPLTIPSGPLWPIKVIFDNSHGRLDEVLGVTKEIFSKGPFTLYRSAVLERLQKLDSWKRKIEKYSGNPMVEFFYAGFFYEVAIRAWFEVQDLWSQAPAEALPVIEEKDPDFYASLADFMASLSSERSKYAENILNVLKESCSKSIEKI